jgi:hypothetical protein
MGTHNSDVIPNFVQLNIRIISPFWFALRLLYRILAIPSVRILMLTELSVLPVSISI